MWHVRFVSDGLAVSYYMQRLVLWFTRVVDFKRLVYLGLR